jgi:hypothetical protein
MTSRHRGSIRRGIGIVLLILVSSALWAGGSDAAKPEPVPVVDGEAGPCSVEMTVTDAAGKPVYGATIRVHVSHGFLGIRKIDLEVGTNAEGKAKFVGLPDDRHEALKFRASKGKQKGTALHNPSETCEAKHFIVLHQH